ncbi:hypothetical protein [Denitrobaculum tricleocarpae]|uniref:Uncharacterized protein n=1 Tax=Denitrobaculum tricleocarpae TaxID=2591009 RepID=A0A545U2L4_9PROT|nr:hypothetical protein [Denitrobaculum tricleocarpae]TQV83696.1 hypothetical protein FKG95_03675 [Denitrobaculum tricleocarpae]
MGQIDHGYDISTVARLMLPSEVERNSIDVLDVLDCDPERMEPIFSVNDPSSYQSAMPER